MLITELKAKEVLASQVSGKVFIINCHGCREIHFPEHEADELQKELVAAGNVTGILTTDYICNLENLKLRLGVEKYKDLAPQLGFQNLFVFQFGNQHITSAPLRRSCPS